MTLPIGSTLVLVLFASDARHLSNFSGDGKVWPLYMTIGNIKSSSIRNKPTSYTWVPVAILQNAPKCIKKVPGWSEEKQEHEALQVLHDLLKFVLHSLSSSARDGHDIKCGDDVVRKCYFRVAGWLADHMENSVIHGIYTTKFTLCELPQDWLGDLQKYPLHDAQQYWEWVAKSDTESLHMSGIKYITNTL